MGRRQQKEESCESQEEVKCQSKLCSIFSLDGERLHQRVEGRALLSALLDVVGHVEHRGRTPSGSQTVKFSP